MPLKGYYRNELEKVDKGSKRLREVMDGLSPAFFVGMLTIEGVMTYTNRTSLEAIGLELKDVIGRLFEDTPWWSYSELYIVNNYVRPLRVRLMVKLHVLT